MEEIGKREFLHHTERYIKPGSFILTRHSIPEYVVTFTTYKEMIREVAMAKSAVFPVLPNDEVYG